MDEVGPPVVGAAAIAPPAEPLEGRFVRLEPTTTAHAEALFARSHATPDDAATWTYMPYGPFEDAGDMASWLATCVGSTDPLFFTVIERATGTPAGMASMLNIDVAMRRLELGHIWYARDAQHGRANTETAYLFLRAAFDAWGYRRAEWKCDALNARSRVAAERLGFTFEGIFRQHMIVKGRNRDTAWFSMLDGEWPARRSAMERWLEAPEGTPLER